MHIPQPENRIIKGMITNSQRGEQSSERGREAMGKRRPWPVATIAKRPEVRSGGVARMGSSSAWPRCPSCLLVSHVISLFRVDLSNGTYR